MVSVQIPFSFIFYFSGSLVAFFLMYHTTILNIYHLKFGDSPWFFVDTLDSDHGFINRNVYMIVVVILWNHGLRLDGVCCTRYESFMHIIFFLCILFAFSLSVSHSRSLCAFILFIIVINTQPSPTRIITNRTLGRYCNT